MIIVIRTKNCNMSKDNKEGDFAQKDEEKEERRKRIPKLPKVETPFAVWCYFWKCLQNIQS